MNVGTVIKKHKKLMIVIACLLVLAAAGIIAGVQHANYQEKLRLEEEMITEKINDVQYGRMFGMFSDVDIMYFVYLTEYFHSEENKDAEVVFVWEEPAVKEPNRISIFPSELTEIYLSNLNGYIDTDSVDLSTYNLTYPLRMEDVLQKRSELRALLNDIDGGALRLIFRKEPW